MPPPDEPFLSERDERGSLSDDWYMRDCVAQGQRLDIVISNEISRIKRLPSWECLLHAVVSSLGHWHSHLGVAERQAASDCLG